MSLQHLRSSTANKRPVPGNMSDGQIAINTNTGSPGLFFKDSNNTLVKVGPVHVGTTAPNASPANGGTAGNSVGEQWLDTSGGTYVFKVWDGSAWRSESGTFVDVNGDVMTGALGIIAGTKAAPGLYFSGDTNTGVFSPSADALALSTGGDERLRITSAGLVGLGIAVPAGPLDLLTGTNRGYFDDAAGSYFRLNAVNAINTAYAPLGLNGSVLTFQIGTGECARFNGSGMLGLGTTDPKTRLHVNDGELTISTGGNVSDAGGIINFGVTTFATFSPMATVQGLLSNAAGTELQGGLGFFTRPAGTAGQTLQRRMTISSQGNVGIGTMNPLAPLVLSNGGAAGLEFNPNSLGSAPTIASYNRSTSAYTQLSYDASQHIFYISGGANERLRITQGGYLKASNDGNYSSATGAYHELYQTANAATLWARSTNVSLADTIHYVTAARSNNSAYHFLVATSGYGGVADDEFRLRGDGNAFADGSWTGGGADYAEYFEWSDSNPNAEDRRGISVVLDGDKIREAVAGEDPIGVISGNPSVVGDSAWNKWSGKYLRDEYGTYIQEDYEVEDEDGNTVIQQRRKLNPAYDPDVEYISREDRPEWDCVGLMGKLRIRKGQVTGSRWIKMRDISDSVEEWLVR